MGNNNPGPNVDVNELENQIDGVIEDWIFDGFYADDDRSSSDSDSSSDESNDEQPAHRRVCIRNYVEVTVPSYSDDEFKSHFRLGRASAYNLIDRFAQSDFLQNNELHENAITYERAFLLTLWYLANTETFRQIADRFNLSKSSAHKVLLNTLDFINSLTEDIIKWPSEEEEKRVISRQFSRRANIRGVIGAIDGCHTRIRRPIEHHEDYLNRKRFHSVILQAVVTSKQIFTDVYVGEPGSMHDARVLRKSPLYHLASDNPNFFGNYCILGDSAYPSRQWLVPPFRDNGRLTRQQRSFNYRHSCTRVYVEQAFGLLRSRFRRLMHFNNLRLDIIIRCIMAACILHNVIMLNNNEHDSDESDNENNDGDNDDLNGDNINHGNEQDRRQTIFNAMFPDNA